MFKIKVKDSTITAYKSEKIPQIYTFIISLYMTSSQNLNWTNGLMFAHWKVNLWLILFIVLYIQ